MNATTASTGDDAAAWLQGKEKELETAVAELVRLNSFTEHVEGGNAVGELLRTFLTMPGLGVERVKSTRFADHWVYRSEGVAAAPPVALIGHLDTVFPPGTFEGYRRDGDLARGPGVLDMKGGLVVVAFALRALAETVGLGALPPLRLVIVGDEEVGSPEGQGIIRSAIADADAALVFEAGRAGDAIITRRKGTGAMTARATGKAAHAGNAHKEGANAIWALARFVDRVQALTDYARGVTVNVGKITGGQSKNTVPDQAEALFDLRFETQADADALIAGVRAAAEAATADLPGTHIELEGGVARLPLERTDKSGALLSAYGAAALRSGLGNAEAGLIGGGSDASTSHAMGIASIDGLGPRGSGFHTKDEQILVASLLWKAQALARFLATQPRAREARA